MEKSNLISIVLPVYNGEKYLSESIESCLNQTYSNIEIIIVNDCSTDNSLNIAKQYERLDSRVRVIDNVTNQKLPNSLNIGHEKAKGDFITWTSDDNLYLPTSIEVMYSALQKEKVDFVYANFIQIDSKGNDIQELLLDEPEELIWKNVVGACFLYTRKLFKGNGVYNNKLFLVEDYDFWLRAFMKFKFHHINNTLYKYRVHEESLTSQLSTINSERNIVFEKNKISMYSNVFLKYEFPVQLQNLIFEFQTKNKIDAKSFVNNLALIKRFYKSLSFGRYEVYLSSLKGVLLKVVKENKGFSQYYFFIILVINFGRYMSFKDFKNASIYLIKNTFSK